MLLVYISAWILNDVMLIYQNLLFTLKCTDNHNKTGQIESYMLNQSCKWPVY